MVHKKRRPRRKHVPQRTCIACRQVVGKREMIRLVRTENGVEVDSTGKRAGRGAYLHPWQSCWRIILQGNRIDSALRTRVSPENRGTLLEFMSTLPESEERSDESTEKSDAALAVSPAERE